MPAQIKKSLSIQGRAQNLFERILILAMVLAFVHLVEDFIYDTPPIWITDVLVLSSAVVSYVLHRKGHQIVARVVGFILITALIGYFAAGTHARNSIQWHFFSIIVLTLIVFTGKYRFVGILFVSLVFVLLLVLELNSYELSWVPEIGVTERSTLSVIINITSSIVILTYAIITLIKGSEQYEARITQQVEDTKKLNKELDSFVYSASHDLKAPLASLRGLLTLARNEKDPTLLELYMSKMDTTITQSENFIKNITDYSRNARIEPKPVDISLRPFLQDLFNDLSFGNGPNQVELMLKLECETIHTDLNRLQAIFGNLLSNAIKYSDPRKPKRWLSISARLNNGFYLFEVEDNGLGISPEHLPHLFEMFYRASELSKGSGLGLYIVNESLQRLGGTIKAESELSKGTKFHLAIPVSAQSQV